MPDSHHLVVAGAFLFYSMQNYPNKSKYRIDKSILDIYPEKGGPCDRCQSLMPYFPLTGRPRFLNSNSGNKKKKKQ